MVYDVKYNLLCGAQEAGRQSLEERTSEMNAVLCFPVLDGCTRVRRAAQEAVF